MNNLLDIFNIKCLPKKYIKLPHLNHCTIEDKCIERSSFFFSRPESADYIVTTTEAQHQNNM
jgi:hypothetical protein